MYRVKVLCKERHPVCETRASERHTSALKPVPKKHTLSLKEEPVKVTPWSESRAKSLNRPVKETHFGPQTRAKETYSTPD